MRTCAFLSMDSLDAFFVYDELLIEPLAQLGWSVELVSWRADNVDWDRFEAVIIRSPWDYQDDAVQFMNVLETIDRSSARLENPLDIVQWNIDKSYLRDMQKKGIAIVPTIWPKKWPAISEAKQWFRELNTEELIIKPLISANADDTFRLTVDRLGKHYTKLENIFGNRAFMVQPFLNRILEEGEYSLFFFEEEFSHAILKKPSPGDFRVQEEHGGSMHSVKPSSLLLEAGNKVMQHIHPTPLYARIDFILSANNTPALIELELIEPSLFFNMDAASPSRFARIFDQRMKRIAGL